MEFEIKDLKFTVEVIIEIRKNRTIYIERPNKVIIKTPTYLSDTDIKNIVSNHQRFIYNHLTRDVSKSKDIIHYLGKEYNLIIIDSDFNNVLVNDFDNTFKVYTKNKNDEYIKYIINNFYNESLQNIVSKYDDKIKQDMNINFNVNYEYKLVKTYFGECFPKERRIILNSKLCKYDLKYILSVIYHEYAHFYYQNHQRNFYKLLNKVFDDYENVQKSLRKIKYNDYY